MKTRKKVTLASVVDECVPLLQLARYAESKGLRPTACGLSLAALKRLDHLQGAEHHKACDQICHRMLGRGLDEIPDAEVEAVLEAKGLHELREAFVRAKPA